MTSALPLLDQSPTTQSQSCIQPNILSSEFESPFELRQGCWASLQDHIRNDVAVRSIAGSVVLKDCTLS